MSFKINKKADSCYDIYDLVPHYDKLLYLDGDIIVRDDLSCLYQIEFENI